MEAFTENPTEEEIAAWEAENGYDWKTGAKKFEEKGGPDKICDAAWSTTEDSFCTAGIKHIYFWRANGFEKKRGIFGKAGKMCDMTCV